MEKRYAIQLEHWVLCPICQSKTRTKIRTDSVLENFPLFCPKCKKEFLVNIKHLEVTVIKEPDAQTQSR
ncbi:cysteine-rich KTR domain-containing protein [Phocaeicola sartorii]|uniref:cysteine-rich KTR domain-containing protein n=1 Tax=Phocaeicola sartorii TaxID=671267 RepID=UPI00338FF309